MKPSHLLKNQILAAGLILGLGLAPAFAQEETASPTEENTPPAEAKTPEDAPAKSDAPPAPILLETPPPAPDKKKDNKDKDAGEARPPARLQAGGRVLSQARKILKTKGCAAAAPAYRVAAGMGEGFEAAQHELGDCLMEIDGETPTETALFRQEGMFWLSRAAFAGNARAQRRLAILHASPVAGAHDPAQSLKWSLVYKNNPEADLYGFGPLPKTMVEGLANDLSPAQVTEAETFAKEFNPITLPAYEPPVADKKARQKVRERVRRTGGQRPRRVAG